MIPNQSHQWFVLKGMDGEGGGEEVGSLDTDLDGGKVKPEKRVKNSGGGGKTWREGKKRYENESKETGSRGSSTKTTILACKKQ